MNKINKELLVKGKRNNDRKKEKTKNKKVIKIKNE